MKVKYLLLAFFSVVSSGAYADVVDEFGVLRTADGIVLAMNQEKAIEACADQNMHLPTIRELAQIAQAMGAKGILELSEVKGGKVPANFYLMRSVNLNGQIDRFYFNSNGYIRPAGIWGKHSFWSSSVQEGNTIHGGYGFNGGIGAIYTTYIGNNAAVRCLSNRRE